MSEKDPTPAATPPQAGGAEGVDLPDLDAQCTLQWIECASDVIASGAQIMTLDQVSRWEGCRGVLEMAPLVRFQVSALAERARALAAQQPGGGA